MAAQQAEESRLDREAQPLEALMQTALIEIVAEHFGELVARGVARAGRRRFGVLPRFAVAQLRIPRAGLRIGKTFDFTQLQLESVRFENTGAVTVGDDYPRNHGHDFPPSRF